MRYLSLMALCFGCALGFASEDKDSSSEQSSTEQTQEVSSAETDAGSEHVAFNAE